MSSSRASRGRTCISWPFSAGGAGLLGACSHFSDTLLGIDWKKLADYMIGRVVVHGERRAREMEEVADTLRAIGIDPIMAEAAARRQDAMGNLQLRCTLDRTVRTPIAKCSTRCREVVGELENLENW